MEFTFEKRPELVVCGRSYSVDLADVGFVEAVVTDFSGLLREYEVLSEMKEQLTVGRAAGFSAESAAELAKQLTDCNRRLIALSRGFIEKTLGEEAYAEIFFGRRLNSAEHINLCAYLYETAIKSREEVVSRYVLPESANRGERRAASKSSGRPRKKAD